MYTLIFRALTAVLEGRAGAGGAVILWGVGGGCVAPVLVSVSVEGIKETVGEGWALGVAGSIFAGVDGCGTAATWSLSPWSGSNLRTVAMLNLCVFRILFLRAGGRLVAEGQDLRHEVSYLELCRHVEARPPSGKKMREDLAVLDLVG